MIIGLVFSLVLFPIKIGQVVPPYPAAYESGQGACVNITIDNGCRNSITLLIDKRSARKYVLSEISNAESQDERKTVVRDILLVPKVQGTFLEYFSCLYKGQTDDTVVALVTSYDQNSPELIPAVRWAYRLNVVSGKFVKITPKDVKCINTAIGSD